MNDQINNNNFNMDLNLNLLVPPGDIKNSNNISSEHSSNRVLLLKKEIPNSKVLFNTFSSNKNSKENKSQKILDNSITHYNKGKLRKINKAKSANYKNIKYYYQEEENKDSYLYLVKLKKYYSTHNYSNLNNTNKSKYNNHTHSSKKSKKKINNNNNELNNTNNYYTINNFYINSKLSMTIGPNNTKKQFNNHNTIQRNKSNSQFNKTNEIRNDISEILNTRKKFNEAYNHFYDVRSKSDNKIKKVTNVNSNDTMEYSSLNEYWNKRNQDNVKKIIKIKNELLKKGKREIKSVPKINNKSKELAINSHKNKSDKFKFNNIFDKLFQSKNLNHSHMYQKREKERSKPKINEKSEKMVRTINDLYLWNNKRQKKIKENENKIYKKEIFNKKNINLTSETILKERRPFYINKKVEDRLIEQGKHLTIKNNKLKEKCIKEMTEQKIYINNNYNHNNKIKSKYMSKEESKNNDINNNNNSNIRKNSRIFNCNYDYNINTFNKRSALFDKNKSNIIQELNEKIDKGNKNANKNPRTLLLQNYMLSKINQNKNNFKIKYNMTDTDEQENKKENIIEDQNKLNEIEELKLGLINNDNYEKNQFSVNKKINMNNNSDRVKREKNSNICRIKDKRKEDLKKIIDFSDKLYKNQNKIIS